MNKHIVIEREDINDIMLYVVSNSNILFAFRMNPEYDDNNFVKDMTEKIKIFINNLNNKNSNFFVKFVMHESIIKIYIENNIFGFEIYFTKNGTINYEMPLEEIENLQNDLNKILYILESDYNEDIYDNDEYATIFEKWNNRFNDINSDDDSNNDDGSNSNDDSNSNNSSNSDDDSNSNSI